MLAIVVCTFNRSQSLLATLESLYACGSHPATDLLVVANRCTDDTLARLQAFRDEHSQESLRLRWIEELTPGKSHALNSALACTDHDVLCFIDDDQVVELGFIDALIVGLHVHPDDDIFCGRIWPAWDGSEPAWVHARPPYAIPIRPFPEFDLGAESCTVAPGERLPSGGNITVRRRVFNRIGGFSVALGPSGHNLAGGEDHDFLQRAVAAGARVRYLPGVRQLHAIDPERTRTSYLLKKSYLRSRSSFLADPQKSSPRPYMFRKILGHGLRAASSLSSAQRLYALVRLAASFGELSAAVEVGRQAGASAKPKASNER